ncbi:MAG: hypothetical protein WAM07_12685, partial [Halobacillus sp.]|uniref:hypothetical protein n=1 Tax=Halobacillus sp. TaxID=56800 RepID=UPI003BAEF029
NAKIISFVRHHFHLRTGTYVLILEYHTTVKIENENLRLKAKACISPLPLVFDTVLEEGGFCR